MNRGHREAVARDYARIPPRKRRRKERRTLWGAVLVAAAVLVAWLRPDWPWGIPVAAGALGIKVLSDDVLTRHAAQILAWGKDLRDTVLPGGEPGDRGD